MVFGSLWMLAINIFRRGIGIVSTVILARLLPPEDFGLVAMASVLLVMVQALTEFGFDIALIQKQDADRTHYDTAWTFKVIFGVSSALLLAGLAWPAATFYSEPRIVAVIIALSVGVAFKGLENIGIVDFRKKLEFSKEFRFFALAKFMATIVTIGSALVFRSYWALVVGTLTNRGAGLILSYVLHPFRPRFSVAARKELFSFSIWLYFNNLLMFVRTRGADFIVGRMLGPRSLGLFSIGSEIASLPTTELIAPINRAIYPGYSRIANDVGRMRRAFLNVFSVIAIVAIPAATGIAVVAKLAIPVLLGPKWVEAVPLVHTMAFVGLLSSLHSNTGSAYIALGKPRIHVILQVCSVIILIPSAIYFAQWYGIIGVAYAYLLANGSIFLVNIFIAMRLLDVSARQLLSSVLRPSIAATAMYFGVAEFQANVAPVVHDGVNLLMSLVLGVLIFVTVDVALWIASGKGKGAETFVVDGMERIPILRSVAKRLQPRSVSH
jgi:PST family polysaccharide transporter